MFTGLIETTGKVLSLQPTAGATRLTLAAPALAGRWRVGDSIAVNGVCLTAIPVADPAHFAADLAAETLVPLQADLNETDWRLTIEAPAELVPYIISQGSITIDGISLTVAKLHGSHPDGSVRFDIAIIPHTYRSTNLHSLEAHSKVNIETDVLAKYAAQLHRPTEDWLTPAYLLANGY